MAKSKSKKKSRKTLKPSNVDPEPPASNCYRGDRLDDLLLKLKKSIEVAKQSKRGLPEKIWIKQQFSIGVNDVTRVLERMPLGEGEGEGGVSSAGVPAKHLARRAPLVPLQAVLLASDINPRWLTKHMPTLASSRKVPLISVKDNRGGSLRLGELVNLKTAMAIGVKAKESIINRAIDEILHGSSSHMDEILETAQERAIKQSLDYIDTEGK